MVNVTEALIIIIYTKISNVEKAISAYIKKKSKIHFSAHVSFTNRQLKCLHLHDMNNYSFLMKLTKKQHIAY